MLRIERAYGSHPKPNEYRVLVDRVWPRGEGKSTIHIDLWAKDIAPSTELRKWFNHKPERFETFAKKYTRELDKNTATLPFIETLDSRTSVVLLYGAKDKKHNQAVVLQEYLRGKL